MWPSRLPAELDMAARDQAVLPLRLRVPSPERTAASTSSRWPIPGSRSSRSGSTCFNSDAENTPPAMALSRYGVVGNLTGIPTFYTDDHRPEDIVTGGRQRRTWMSPSCGARLPATSPSSPRCRLMLRPLAGTRLGRPTSRSASTSRWRVRRSDQALRDSLRRSSTEGGPEIQAILKEYGIPTFPHPCSAIARRDSGQAAKPWPAGAGAPARTAKHALSCPIQAIADSRACVRPSRQ